MVKYSEEFKLNLVSEYLSGPLGYSRLVQKYGMCRVRPIEQAFFQPPVIDSEAIVILE